MKKIILIFSVIFFLIAVNLIIVNLSNNKTNYGTIKAEQLDTYMKNNPDSQYIDVRTPMEYSETHIEGFKNIENTEILKGNHQLDLEKEVVIICRTGTRSKKVANYLAQEGYNVINVEDGLNNY